MNAVTKAAPAETAVANYSASIMDVIAQAARDPSVDIDKMERLIAMQERIQAREAEVAFSDAFAAMQPELPVISKNGQIVHNNRVISEFSEWEDINPAITPVLAKHGFSLSFKPAEVDKKIAVTAILRHRLGFKDDATLPLPTDTSGAKNAVQGVGSTLSYGKRYAAVLLLNITTGGGDDDGASAGPKSQHDAARDAPFPQGPARNKTNLKELGKVLWRDVAASGDMDTLDIVLNGNAELIDQLKVALPSWWSGGKDEGGMAFEGLGQIVSRMKRDFGQAQ